MPVDIHPTAIVDPKAELGEGVAIGPYSIVGPGARLGDRVRLDAHVVVDGLTAIGADTRIFPFAAIGTPPQDLKYKGEASRLVIGARNRIREHVTMHPGTEGGGMITRVGDDGLFMVGVHVAHDCVLGDHVIMANNATLGGHVEIGDFAIIGGLAAVHQFVRIGAHAMIGGMSGVENDVIPFGSVMGERGRLAGLNVIGMKRRGFDKAELHVLRGAYRTLFSDAGVMEERIAAVEAAHGANPAVRAILDFIRAESSRGLIQAR